MTYQEVLEQARTCMGKCHACPVCNGLACKNTVPGPGAKGLGTGAIRNYQKWQELCVNMDTICENGDVDTSYDFFGHKLTIPVMAGPVGAVAMHYSDKYDDLRYNNVLVEGCAKAGILAFTGDGTNPAVMEGAEPVAALVGTIERRFDLAAVQLAFSLQLSEEGSGREQKTFELEICSVHPELRMIAGPRIADEL
mgnify:CR=1 FL=1